ncbi:hypothetical protein OG563_37885 [Nocardia vinacea]|uniref:Integrase catalytic domain-containing protein n=1 Tax=Nocardia vinacea TaxID=96468 RepID=A0ABZ1YSC3_9NOCA|nr:hypothetical protein [Nocardia vinacea]
MLVVDASRRALRQVAIDRLAQMSEQGFLSSDHVRSTAETLGVAERTVWRWVSARKLETPGLQRDRFRIDDRLRVRLACWRGNAAAPERELAEQHRAGDPPVPSVSTVGLPGVVRVDQGKDFLSGTVREALGPSGWWTCRATPRT